MLHRALIFGRFRFDPQQRVLYQDDQLVPLTSRSAEVLALLLDRPGEVISREEFLQFVWKDTFVEPRNLTQCIFLLRKALDDPNGDSTIETVSKRGYRFIAPVIAKEAENGNRPVNPVPRRFRMNKPWSAVVAFTVIASGAYTIFWRSAPAPAPPTSMTRLTWTGSAHDPDVSPDGKFIVYVAEDSATRYAIYRLDLTTFSTRLITLPSADPVESPAISSDGRWVVYRSSSGDGAIMVVPSDGSRPPALVPDSSRGRNPRWRPGQNAITYWAASEEHNRALGIVSFQTIDPPGKPIRAFQGFDTATFPLWSPDGSVILSLATWRSGIPEHEFDAWISPSMDVPSVEKNIRTGLFDLLKSRKLYATVRDRSRITVSGWRDGYLYLSIHNGNTANLYRVRIGSDYKVSGEPEQLTFAANLLLTPRVSSAGPLVFSTVTLSQHPVRVAFDGSTLQPLPIAQGGLSRLSLTADGGRIVAEQYTPGEALRIISTAYASTSPTLVATGSVAFPVISPDGHSIAWRSMEGRKQSIDLALASGGSARRVCDDCGAPEEWTPDSSAVLFHTGGSPARIGYLDVKSGRSYDWIIHPDWGVFAARTFSPPGQQGWVTFYAENTQRTRRIFVAPVNDYRQIPVESWIPITDGSVWDSSPVWAASGNALYFVSQRDGHRCIYHVRLHPTTKRPLGPPQPLRHFHSYSQSLALFNPARAAENIRSAAGGLYLVLDEVSSSIWSLNP